MKPFDLIKKSALLISLISGLCTLISFLLIDLPLIKVPFGSGDHLTEIPKFFIALIPAIALGLIVYLILQFSKNQQQISIETYGLTVDEKFNELYTSFESFKAVNATLLNLRQETETNRNVQYAKESYYYHELWTVRLKEWEDLFASLSRANPHLSGEQIKSMIEDAQIEGKEELQAKLNDLRNQG